MYIFFVYRERFFYTQSWEIWCRHMNLHSIMSHVMSNCAADLWGGGREDCRILMLTTHLHPLQTPPSPTFDNVQSRNEWFCVLCDYILPHTPHVDKATTCIHTI